jgi:hypothetical protein
MLLTVSAKEQDYNKLWNHLLVAKSASAMPCGGEDGKARLVVSGEVYLSWSQVKKELPFKEGEQILAKITATCGAGFGLDEEMSDLTNSWISYRVWTCDVDKLEIVK